MANVTYKSIYEAVRKVPYGRVSTYGRIAKIVGCSARMVGYAMAALPEDEDAPWHRIVNREGRISLRTWTDGDLVQRKMLELEGVVFDDRGGIDLSVYLWTEVEPEV
jgi:methylated-DNA-protein-cysteine methyltransferase-like protein